MRSESQRGEEWINAGPGTRDSHGNPQQSLRGASAIPDWTGLAGRVGKARNQRAVRIGWRPRRAVAAAASAALVGVRGAAAVFFDDGDGVMAPEPAMQVHILTTRRAEGSCGVLCRLAADRALARGLAGWGHGVFASVSAWRRAPVSASLSAATGPLSSGTSGGQ